MQRSLVEILRQNLEYFRHILLQSTLHRKLRTHRIAGDHITTCAWWVASWALVMEIRYRLISEVWGVTNLAKKKTKSSLEVSCLIILLELIFDLTRAKVLFES